ncbi:hypothetical protein KIPE111705_30770 [Kibdelosporangium persicum]
MSEMIFPLILIAAFVLIALMLRFLERKRR